MNKYIQPKIKVLALPEIMQNLYEGTTQEGQLAKPLADDTNSEHESGWGMENWGADFTVWDEE